MNAKIGKFIVALVAGYAYLGALIVSCSKITPPPPAAPYDVRARASRPSDLPAADKSLETWLTTHQLTVRQFHATAQRPPSGGGR